jgi:hypothetical protein
MIHKHNTPQRTHTHTHTHLQYPLAGYDLTCVPFRALAAPSGVDAASEAAWEDGEDAETTSSTAGEPSPVHARRRMVLAHPAEAAACVTSASADFHAYYTQQSLCSDSDWAVVERRLCAPLPLSVRVNESTGLAGEILPLPFLRYRFCELKYRGAVGRRQVHCTLIVKIIRFYC